MKYHALQPIGTFAFLLGLFLAACQPITQTELITPSPTISAPTREPTMATRVSETSTTPSGQLYVWSDGFPSVFGILEVNNPNMIQPVQPTSSSIADPTQAVALAFSNNLDRIAYLTHTDELELHVADIDLAEGTTVKLERLTWLINKLDAGERISLYWGPGDKTVLIINDEEGEDGVVFLIDENRTEYLSEGCNHFSSINSVQGPALWCRLRQPADSYLVLQGDGRLRLEQALPPVDTVDVKEVALARDGKTALLIMDDGKVLLAKSNGERVETPIKYAERLWRIPRHLHWSLDDSLALVYGNSSQCPLFFNDETNQHLVRPCWHVIDSRTGSLIWHPTAELASAISSTWDRINATDYPAALSPDGTWLALSFREGGLRYLVLTSLDYSHTELVGNFTATGLIWKP